MVKIGIPSCFLYPDPTRNVFGPKLLCYIANDFAKFISRKGVMPVLIPDFYGDDMEQFLGELDGLVLQGGTDMAPESYGEKPIGKWKGDKYRDEFELTILDWAIKAGKPVLGICRGLQVMNVYFGGTLYQDIATQLPDALTHRDAEKYDQLSHAIAFNKGKLLDKLYNGELEKTVNSVHHQGVKELGKSLEALAYCPVDGMIEAFGWTGADEGKVMAVQWHPEFFFNYKKGKLIDGGKVYEKFLEFCGSRL